MAKHIEVQLTKDRETKNTVRYAEGVDADKAILRTLYVKKEQVKKLGDPETIKVTVEGV